MLLTLENWCLFRPIRADRYWQDPPDNRVQNVELTTPAGERLHAWWCPTENWDSSRGTVLFLHGNSGNLSHCVQSIQRWQQEMECGVFIIDYPGYGRSGGRPSEAGCYAAADAAHDWLTGTLQVPPENLLLFGGSLGCGVALDLAVRRPHRALVLVAPFTSFPDMAQRYCPIVPRRRITNQFDNLTKIGKCRRPVFLAHGTADRVIPFAQGERLFAAANEPRAFFPMPGYGHQHRPGPEFFQALRAFLARVAPLPMGERATN